MACRKAVREKEGSCTWVSRGEGRGVNVMSNDS